MLYLSRLTLDDHNVVVRRDLADCHRLHVTLLTAYPQVVDGLNARAHFGVLYRLEQGNRGRLRVLVQSAAEPHWATLPQGYFLAPPECRRVDEQYASLRAGMLLRFRLRANPTKRVSAHDGSEGQARWKGKRVELRGEEAQLAWLHRKGAQGGFALLDVHVAPGVADVRSTPETTITGRRPGPRDNKAARLTFGSALFEGRLQVTDAEAFRQSLERGIGSGKAYGFGLLSVAASRE